MGEAAPPSASGPSADAASGEPCWQKLNWRDTVIEFCRDAEGYRFRRRDAPEFVLRAADLTEMEEMLTAGPVWASA